VVRRSNLPPPPVIAGWLPLGLTPGPDDGMRRREGGEQCAPPPRLDPPNPVVERPTMSPSILRAIRPTRLGWFAPLRIVVLWQKAKVRLREGAAILWPGKPHNP
jgi:hypothetical protein